MHLTFKLCFVDVVLFFLCPVDVCIVVVSYVALLMLFVFSLNSCVGGFSLIRLGHSCCLKKATCVWHLADVVVIWAGLGPCMVLCWVALWVWAWVGPDVV